MTDSDKEMMMASKQASRQLKHLIDRVQEEMPGFKLVVIGARLVDDPEDPETAVLQLSVASNQEREVSVYMLQAALACEESKTASERVQEVMDKLGGSEHGIH